MRRVSQCHGQFLPACNLTPHSPLQLSVGSVRSKNAKNIVLKNLLDACFGAVCFYLLGYGFAYGGDNDEGDTGNNFIGWSQFALNSESGLAKSGWYGWFFQFAVRSQCIARAMSPGMH